MAVLLADVLDQSYQFRGRPADVVVHDDPVELRFRGQFDPARASRAATRSAGLGAAAGQPALQFGPRRRGQEDQEGVRQTTSGPAARPATRSRAAPAGRPPGAPRRRGAASRTGCRRTRRVRATPPPRPSARTRHGRRSSTRRRRSRRAASPAWSPRPRPRRADRARARGPRPCPSPLPTARTARSAGSRQRNLPGRTAGADSRAGEFGKRDLCGRPSPSSALRPAPHTSAPSPNVQSRSVARNRSPASRPRGTKPGCARLLARKSSAARSRCSSNSRVKPQRAADVLAVDEQVGQRGHRRVQRRAEPAARARAQQRGDLGAGRCAARRASAALARWKLPRARSQLAGDVCLAGDERHQHVRGDLVHRPLAAQARRGQLLRVQTVDEVGEPDAFLGDVLPHRHEGIVVTRRTVARDRDRHR